MQISSLMQANRIDFLHLVQGRISIVARLYIGLSRIDNIMLPLGWRERYRFLWRRQLPIRTAMWLSCATHNATLVNIDHYRK